MASLLFKRLSDVLRRSFLIKKKPYVPTVQKTISFITICSVEGIMFEKIENSWKLAKECWRVLMLDKEMLVYPIINAILSIGVLIIAYFGLVELDLIGRGNDIPVTQNEKVFIWVLLAITLYSIIFIQSFSQTAIIASALIRLRGDNPTLLDGFNVATLKIFHIAIWSLVHFLFGVVRSLIMSLFKGKFMRERVGDLIESGWNVITVFIIPIIIMENTNVYNAFKRSKLLLKKKWGEAVGLEVGFYSLSWIIAIPLAFIFLLGYNLHETYPMFAIIVFSIAVILTIITSAIYSALTGISKAVMYNFAIDKNIPTGFDQNAFVQRN